jgi:hypothetical protein
MVMKRYLLAAVASVVFIGFVAAEEFSLRIMSIDMDGSVTGVRMTKAKGPSGNKGEKVTVKLARDVQVHKGKRDPKTEGFVADGDDLKLAGLKTALQKALNGDVIILGKPLAEKDMLEVSVSDGKPVAKLNGKEISLATVNLRGKEPLDTHVTTSEDGVVTKILLTRGLFLGFKKKDNN